MNVISLFSEDIEYQYPRRIDLLKAWIKDTLGKEERMLDYLNIIFCSDSYLLKINQQYLHHDYYTDIITFDYGEAVVQGELFISIDRVRDNARALNLSFEQELHRVIIHGVLHICGYRDKTKDEIKVIRQKEDQYLKKIPFSQVDLDHKI